MRLLFAGAKRSHRPSGSPHADRRRVRGDRTRPHAGHRPRTPRRFSRMRGSDRPRRGCTQISTRLHRAHAERDPRPTAAAADGARYGDDQPAPYRSDGQPHCWGERSPDHLPGSWRTPTIPDGGGVKTEGEPLWRDPPRQFAPVVSALHDMEQQIATAGGVVLGLGHLYGPAPVAPSTAASPHRSRQARLRWSAPAPAIPSSPSSTPITSRRAASALSNIR